MAQDNTVRVVLGGVLGRKFGAEWKLHLSVPSPAEAFRAIDANTRGEFRRYLRAQGTSKFYKVALARKSNTLGEDELSVATGHQDIYLLPAVKGREKAGTKILAAVAIAALTYFTAGAAASFLSVSTTVVQTVGYSMAASLALGGITQMLTPNPSFDQNNQQDDKHSNVFQGNAATVSQGGAVPLVYGRALVTPMPISISFTAEDQTIVNSFAPQGYTTVTGPGGIIDYVPIETDPTANLP